LNNHEHIQIPTSNRIYDQCKTIE